LVDEVEVHVAGRRTADVGDLAAHPELVRERPSQHGADPGVQLRNGERRFFGEQPVLHLRHSRPMHTEIGPGVIQIDTLLGGWHNVTAGYLIQGREPVLVETGSQSSVDALLAALAELNVAPTDLAGIAVTHIHLDHAGGVGNVAAAFPNATVYVHEKGARHLVDPTRLIDSAARVYGE